MENSPRSNLFHRTGLVIALSLLVFFLFSFGLIFYFILVPMAKQSTDDLAGFIIFSSQTWNELPQDAHIGFSKELFDSHAIKLTTVIPSLQNSPVESPYINFLKDAFSKRLGLKEPIRIWSDKNNILWVNIATTSKESLWFGFKSDRIGVQPSVVIIWVILGGIILTIITSLLLVRRLTLPLQRLYSATKSFANNQAIVHVPETGPHELATLTRSFNQMTKQIYELMENRTTLLAGISHDLRTPITRMHLATEMLNQDEDPQLIKQIKTDLNDMADLIQSTLEIAKGFDSSSQELTTIDVADIIANVIRHYPKQTNIKWKSPDIQCKQSLNVIALRRVLTNILDNALTYAGDKQIEIRYHCSDDSTLVEILDRGRGIPSDKIENVFQPFYRLEISRNRATGGSGLGLAIVKQLCNANSWEIKLEARKGGGVAAKLTIPKKSPIP